MYGHRTSEVRTAEARFLSQRLSEQTLQNNTKNNHSKTTRSNINSIQTAEITERLNVAISGRDKLSRFLVMLKQIKQSFVLSRIVALFIHTCFRWHTKIVYCTNITRRLVLYAIMSYFIFSGSRTIILKFWERKLQEYCYLVYMHWCADSFTVDNTTLL